MERNKNKNKIKKNQEEFSWVSFSKKEQVPWRKKKKAHCEIATYSFYLIFPPPPPKKKKPPSPYRKEESRPFTPASHPPQREI